jgi:hypothetical protein
LGGKGEGTSLPTEGWGEGTSLPTEGWAQGTSLPTEGWARVASVKLIVNERDWAGLYLIGENA